MASRLRYVNTCAFNGLSCQFFSFFLKKSDTFNTQVIPESSSSSAVVSLSVLPFESANRDCKPEIQNGACVWRKEHFRAASFFSKYFFYDMYIGFKLELLYMTKKFFNSYGRLVNKFFFLRCL